MVNVLLSRHACRISSRNLNTDATIHQICASCTTVNVQGNKDSTQIRLAPIVALPFRDPSTRELPEQSQNHYSIPTKNSTDSVIPIFPIFPFYSPFCKRPVNQFPHCLVTLRPLNSLFSLCLQLYHVGVRITPVAG